MCFFRNASARNTHVEATLNHPFPAQVGDVADRNSGMYTAARSFLPGVRRLRERLEGQALGAPPPPVAQARAHGLDRGLAAPPPAR